MGNNISVVWLPPHLGDHGPPQLFAVQVVVQHLLGLADGGVQPRDSERALVFALFLVADADDRPQHLADPLDAQPVLADEGADEVVGEQQRELGRRRPQRQQRRRQRRRQRQRFQQHQRRLQRQLRVVVAAGQAPRFVVISADHQREVLDEAAGDDADGAVEGVGGPLELDEPLVGVGQKQLRRDHQHVVLLLDLLDASALGADQRPHLLVGDKQPQRRGFAVDVGGRRQLFKREERVLGLGGALGAQVDEGLREQRERLGGVVKRAQHRQDALVGARLQLGDAGAGVGLVADGVDDQAVLADKAAGLFGAHQHAEHDERQQQGGVVDQREQGQRRGHGGGRPGLGGRVQRRLQGDGRGVASGVAGELGVEQRFSH